jgi:hypothetical protein
MGCQDDHFILRIEYGVQDIEDGLFCARGDDNILYCTVKADGHGARFLRSSYYQIAEFFDYDDVGDSYFLPLNGKRYYIKEKMHIEFFAEAFNLANRTQITGVNTTFYTLSGTTLNYNSSFGAITEAGGTLYRERQLQLAVRFAF